MRTISNAMLASNARVAEANGYLAAPHGRDGYLDFSNGLVCAVGASMTAQELDRTREQDPIKLRVVQFEDVRYAQAVSRAHDRWARSQSWRFWLWHRRAHCRSEYCRLLDLHDPVRQLAALPALRDAVEA